MADRRVNMLYPLVIACLVAVIVITVYFCCFNSLTTVLVVRHAEKAETPADNPPLTSQGQARAEALVDVAGDAGVGAVYATEFCRTAQTAQPLAAQLGLPINVQENTLPDDQLANCNPPIDATVNRLAAEIGTPAELVDHVLGNHRGKIILIAGHSNTVPQIVEELGAPRRYAPTTSRLRAALASFLMVNSTTCSL